MTDSQNIRVTSSSLRLERPEGNLADEMLSMMRPDSTTEDLVIAARAYEVLKKHERAKQEQP